MIIRTPACTGRNAPTPERLLGRWLSGGSRERPLSPIWTTVARAMAGGAPGRWQGLPHDVTAAILRELRAALTPGPPTTAAGVSPSATRG
jgi:hypothetical protein